MFRAHLWEVLSQKPVNAIKNQERIIYFKCKWVQQLFFRSVVKDNCKYDAKIRNRWYIQVQTSAALIFQYHFSQILINVTQRTESDSIFQVQISAALIFQKGFLTDTRKCDKKNRHRLYISSANEYITHVLTGNSAKSEVVAKRVSIWLCDSLNLWSLIKSPCTGVVQVVSKIIVQMWGELHGWL